MIRILFLADTHLGFDLPAHPRVQRRRRGHDFQRNYLLALAPALRAEVDLVVHGGDLFHKPNIPASVIEQGLRPLTELAEDGVPVFLVPGNHERSRVPQHLWTAHPNLHIFNAPRTFTCTVNGEVVALSGFPHIYQGRDQFSEAVDLTAHSKVQADLRLLCIHLVVEGAQVGAHDYTFRAGTEVVPGAEIPGEFAAVLSGHIHRQQVLRHDPAGRPLASPVIYPGAIERTSFAEREETKGYSLLEFGPDRDGRWALMDHQFVPLPARPMVQIETSSHIESKKAMATNLQGQIAGLAPDSIVRVHWNNLNGGPPSPPLSAADLRALAPPEMNIRWAGPFRRAVDAADGPSAGRSRG